MSQIMNLLNLTPVIQEDLLFLDDRRLADRTMRPIVAELDWGKQRRMRGTGRKIRCDLSLRHFMRSGRPGSLVHS
jgi:hypothetical protein